MTILSKVTWSIANFAQTNLYFFPLMIYSQKVSVMYNLMEKETQIDS
jgi:hypothetical protein